MSLTFAAVLSLFLLVVAIPIFCYHLERHAQKWRDYVEYVDHPPDQMGTWLPDAVPVIPGTPEPEKEAPPIRHNAERETCSYLATIPGKGDKTWEYSADEIARFVHVRRGDALQLIRLARHQEES